MISKFPAFYVDSKLNKIGIADGDVFEQLENDKKNLYAFVSSLEEHEIIDFEVTNEIDRDNLLYLCHGRTYSLWFENGVDFRGDFYQAWCFKEVYVKFELILLLFDNST